MSLNRQGSDGRLTIASTSRRAYAGSMFAHLTPPPWLEIVAVGLTATLVCDLLLAVASALGLSPPNWSLIGRWVGGWSRGAFVHSNIAAAPPFAGERALGWIFHYLVGLGFAAVYLTLARRLGFPPAAFAPAFVFGLVTLAAPWCLLQPAIGLGFFARRAASPAQVRLTNVAAHAFFGVGLFAGAFLFAS